MKLLEKIRGKSIKEQKQPGQNNKVSLQEEKINKSALLLENQRLIIKRLKKRIKESDFATGNIIYNINYVSDSVNNQIKFIDNVMDKIQSHSALAEEVVASTANSEQIVEDTLKMAKAGNKAVDESIDAITEIEESVDYVKEEVTALSGHAFEINNILSVIKDISAQTNLLSLNAAIEAARAGEHGRGFAVVADEVRKLAIESDRSAGKISTTIKKINESINNTLNAMEKSTAKVEEGVKIANNTNLVFNQIIDSITKTVGLTQEINSAINEQTTSLEEVIYSTDELNEVAEKIMTMIEIMTMNTEQINSSINLLAMTVENLEEVSKDIESTKEISYNATKSDKNITTVIAEKMKTKDPAMAFDTDTCTILNNINSGLLLMGNFGEILPGVAKSWYLKEDNLTWVFNLRKGAKFHNGIEITADDVKFSLERILDQKLDSPNSWFLMEIEGAKEYNNGKTKDVVGIKILDKYRIAIKLANPYSGFLLNLAQSSCSILSKEALRKGDFIGCGPYMITDEDNEKYILRAYKDYFGGQPYIDRIDIIYKDDNVTEGYLNGKYDFGKINGKQLEEVKSKSYRGKIKTKTMMATNFWGFNFKRNTIFSRNKNIRKAINYGINRIKIIDEAYRGMGIEAKGIFPPEIIDNDRLPNLSYNKNRAKKILKEEGYYKNKEKLKILTYKENNGKHIDYVIKDLKDIGIEVECIVAEGDYISVDNINRCDIYSIGWIADTGDPDNFLQPLVNSENFTNFGKYKNEEVLSLLEDAKKIINPRKRIEAYKHIEKKIMADMPWILISYTKLAYVHKDNLINVKLSPLEKYKFDEFIIKS